MKLMPENKCRTGYRNNGAEKGHCTAFRINHRATQREAGDDSTTRSALVTTANWLDSARRKSSRV